MNITDPVLKEALALSQKAQAEKRLKWWHCHQSYFASLGMTGTVTFVQYCELYDTWIIEGYI